VRISGFIALAYAVAVTLSEGLSAWDEDRSMQKASAEVSAMAQSADGARKLLLRSPEVLTASSSLESSPDRVLADLRELLPAGVSVVSYKIEYLLESPARVELGVVAQGPEVYDRFLSALSKSKRFGEIRPGSESRPGLVRATVLLLHHPKGSGK
jgi:hypothetical protein